MVYRWKGKLVSKTIYQRNIKLSEIGKRNRKPVIVAVKEEHNQQNSIENNSTEGEVKNPLDVENIIPEEKAWVVKKKILYLPPIGAFREGQKPAGNCIAEKSSHEEQTRVSEERSLTEEMCLSEDCARKEEIPISDKDPLADESSGEDEFPAEGYRIVDLEWMAKSMRCDFCREDLSLKYMEREVRSGFGSFLYIRCKECLLLNKIETGKQHYSNESGRRIFDINTKSVLGALHTGLKYSHVKKFMEAINVPPMPLTLFKRREKEIRTVVEMITSKTGPKTAPKGAKSRVKKSG